MAHAEDRPCAFPATMRHSGEMENTWLFPLIEALHVVGLALLVGTIALSDLGVLGWMPRPRPLGRYTHFGLALTLSTGALLFAAGFHRYLANPAFVVKMAVLAAALAAHYTLRRRETRGTAGLSLVLWTLVVLSARAVIDFDV